MTGGKNPVVTAAGCPNGTKLEISRLFFNTPARKKYLKSEATEYRHILETLQDGALAHPGIRFRFVSNGRTIFDFLETEELQARIGGLFGKSLSDEMTPLFYGGQALQVSGYVGKPHTARSTRKYQYFVVNGRPVQDVRLSYAVKEAYSDLIPSSQYPIFVICVQLDPEEVDVNVHPRKLEVRFASPQEVFRVIKSSVQAAIQRQSTIAPLALRTRDLEKPAFLRKASIQPTLQQKVEVEETGETYDPRVTAAAPLWSPNPTPSSYSAFAPAPSVGSTGAGTVSPLFSSVMSPSTPVATDPTLDARKAYLLQKRAARLAAQGLDPSEMPSMSSGPVSSVFASPVPSQAPKVSEPYVASSPVFDPSVTLGSPHDLAMRDFSETMSTSLRFVASPLRLIAQVRQSFLLAEDDEGLVIVDQHAAHERVMLAKFRANETEREPASQPLLTPLQLDLTYREKAILDEHLDLLKSVGFDIQPFGGNTYQIEAVPDFLANEDLDEILKGFIDDLLNEEAPREAARRHDHLLHTLACRAATKFGRRLTVREQEALVQSLFGTEGSSSCAHGRPTMIRLSFEELERRFGRKG
jgi:DNA mismatch repair protein MutL